MNNKIFGLILKNLSIAFHLPRYQEAMKQVGPDTVLLELPWTPARLRKFINALETELDIDCDLEGTIKEVVNRLDRKYLSRFFGEIWKPRTEDYGYTGWNLAAEIESQNPKAVLDVGCGYHPFKGRISNLVGIDPFNDCADYQVDILDYKVKPESYDHIIALGSINFNSRDDIEARFAHCVKLLMPDGKIYMRANPGIPHKNGPYVDIFPWSFQVVYELADKYGLSVVTYKQDANDRLYFVFRKPTKTSIY